MRRAFIVTVSIIVCLGMMSAPVLGQDLQCKQVFTQFEGGTYKAAPDCQFGDTSHAYCIEVPIKGTLNGTYYFYFPTYGNYVDAVDPMPGHTGLAAGWGIGRFVTNHGEIWSRDSWLVDLAHLADFAAFAQISYVVGGTGMYENATGDIFQFGSDLGGGDMRGQVCTPQ